MVKPYGLNELRKMFLDYFEGKGHLVKSSFSLIPQNDKSLLLINSGMAPLKPYFTGQEVPPSKRMATCQKCIRTGDIENVGKTSRHGTFFEMLGNFSFGDYFKKEALQWSWEFLTKIVGIPEDRLYPSVYEEDDEAFAIWRDEIGVSEERIARLGKEDNFWEHGAGPCGPSSEIYYDRGERSGCGKEGCAPGCDCDRYIEIWNDVFTQFEGDGEGNYQELDSKNIDTGMGLERLASVVQGVDTIFDVDTIRMIRDKVCEAAKATYNEDGVKDVSIRLITDHVRSGTFLVADGVIPSNEGRGYVLRRLLRRVARHGKLLGIRNAFMVDLSAAVIEASKDGYPELEEKKEYIFKVVQTEEENFNKMIDRGLAILTDMKDDLVREGKKVLSGGDAFKLYDTFGFPVELTKEILEESGISIDEEGFQKAMDVQRRTASEARGATNYMGAEVTVYQSLDPSLTTRFVGYDRLEHSSKVVALTTEQEVVEELAEGCKGTVLVDETPFYATMGGQMADAGRIRLLTDDGGACAEFVVEDVIKLQGDKVGHVGHMEKGAFQTGDAVSLAVDGEKRTATAKNHSATHLLQQALRLVLGDHVQQAGSMVDGDRLRFDFTHFSAMTAEEVEKVEDLVNREVQNGLAVETSVMTLDEARKSGATALFGEKYGESVRVVRMGTFSTELCGGTHVSNTAEVTAFKILSETGIAAGVRRIEALTAKGVFDYFKQLEDSLHLVAKTLRTTPFAVGQKVEAMQDEIRKLQSENEKLKDKLAKESLGDVMDQVVDVGGVRLLATEVSGVDANGLRNLGDQLKEKMGSGVVVLASSQEGKVNLLAMATDDAVAGGAHAGNLVREIAGLVGGKGGGRPNMAMAGGKNPDGIPAALEKAKEAVKGQLG